MNKHLIRLTGMMLFVLCVGLSCQAKETDPEKVSSGPKTMSLFGEFKTDVPLGEFRVTGVVAKDSIIIEANQAPIVPLLQAIAQQTNRKIIVSDELQNATQKITFSANKWEGSFERVLNFLSTSSLSWGKVGQDTYLVVARQKSSTELAAQKNKMDQVQQSRVQEQKEEPQQEPKQAPPMQVPPGAHFWLLRPTQQ